LALKSFGISSIVNAGLMDRGSIMSPTVQSLGIDQLTREQRITLVQEIWAMIAAEPYQPLLTEAQREELKRRVAEDNANPDDVVPWEQVKAQALSRLKQ
jgi:putative addiction module component (TIGR02574 family)